MTIQQIIVLGLIFVAVAGAVLGVGIAVSRSAELRRRLHGLGGDGSQLTIEPAASEWKSTVLKVAEPVAKLAQPSSEEELSSFRQRFVHAGLRGAGAPVVFFTIKAALAVGLPGLFYAAYQFFSLKFQPNTAMTLMLFLAAIGYYLPNAVLSSMTRRRQRDLFEAFPDAIDLMIVCVEAGLSLDMAINRAAEELALRSRVLAEELQLVGLELRVGASRERALRNLAARTGLEEISTFVAMILQADRFGTSIADALRVHADELRMRRRLRAEEAAAKIPLKLLFPLIFCIFPSLLLVLMGPAMIQIYRVLLPTMSGR
jgi:tight adherence protein C